MKDSKKKKDTEAKFAMWCEQVDGGVGGLLTVGSPGGERGRGLNVPPRLQPAQGSRKIIAIPTPRPSCLVSCKVTSTHESARRYSMCLSNSATLVECCRGHCFENGSAYR
jgi:hypothetical protein